MRTIVHDHQPIYRVVRATYADPLDSSFSRNRGGNRWNPPDGFAALYTCCSERVARAVALDIFRYAGLALDDLQPAARPQLAEIEWRGDVVDVMTVVGILAVGFPDRYPDDVEQRETQSRASEWHAAGFEGVVCRSASLARLGEVSWRGEHVAWGELAIFVENATRQPRLIDRRADLEWLVARS